ncbi:MAG: exosortase/archaeosortase family protein [Armatimonadota bacterium]
MSTIDGIGKGHDRRARAWVFVIIAAAVIMYIPTLGYLRDKWIEDAQYSLGFLVPLVSGYFVWKKWPDTAGLTKSPSIWGLVLILIGLLLHLSGTLLDLSGPSGVSIIIVLIGGCLYFHGKGLLKLMAFPLAYMVFMIPVPGGLIDRVGLPMQLLASGSTAHILSFLGLDVSRAGIQISVEGYQFEVAPACSGMSSLVALVGVSAVFAYLTRLRPALKWTLFALSLPIALAANIVRITTIALVGYQWGWENAMHIYHDWSSPILFLVAIILLFVINWGFEWLSARRTTASS